MDHVDAFICVSKQVYDAQVIPTISYKYHLVYNGINTHRFPTIESKHKEPKQFIVGYAGRITENKGIYELLEAIKILHSDNSDIRLRICGDGIHDDIQELHHYIMQYDMKDYVEYIGFQQDMNRFYRFIDCLVAPSKVREAFGLVLCEAMYCKVPVIASTSGAQGEIIENGVSGILIDAVNSEVIAKSIQKLMQDDVIRVSMVDQGYKRVESTFTIAKMVDSIVTIIRNLR